MTDDPSDDENCGCNGCTLTLSRNGEPPLPVTPPVGASSQSMTQILAPTTALVGITMTFDCQAGACDPDQNCAPKEPCKIKNLKVNVMPFGFDGTMVVTDVTGAPLTDELARFVCAEGVTTIVALPDKELVCGGSLKLEFKWTGWDPSVSQVVTKTQTWQINCTECEIDPT